MQKVGRGTSRRVINEKRADETKHPKNRYMMRREYCHWLTICDCESALITLGGCARAQQQGCNLIGGG